MQAPIVIIGSGFAAYQLVKTIRRIDAQIPIQLFTADDGAEYNKPDLSHVFTKQQTAHDLVVKTGHVFAQEYNVDLHANTWVESIDTHAQHILAEGCTYPYSKLVLAMGANPFVPPMQGNAVEEVVTLNSLQEYQAAEVKISTATRALVMGGGLIGVEIAMDLASSGKAVTIVEPNPRLLANLIPEFVALPLEKQLKQQGIQLNLERSVVEMNRSGTTLTVRLSGGQMVETDVVIVAAGLRANTQLAKASGIQVRKGIVVDASLQTSAPHVFALGDCAEIQGRLMPYLQPIVLSANVLGKQLLGQSAELVLPPMMIKVKTPSYPIQLAGRFDNIAAWRVQMSQSGIVAQAENESEQFTGFVVTGEHVAQAFPLLRELSQVVIQSSPNSIHHERGVSYVTSTY